MVNPLLCAVIDIVTWCLQVKVQGSNEDMLLAACQQFMGKSEKEIEEIAMETLEGHQRAIMGQMTVEVSVGKRNS